MADEQDSGSQQERITDGSGTKHPPSEVDAMGLDKHRTVVGGQYGATVRKQATVYGIFFAVVIALTIGFLTVVSNIDNRDIPLEDTGPWTQAQAQAEPRPIDFPENGPTNTIPADEIGKAPEPGVSDSQTGS